MKIKTKLSALLCALAMLAGTVSVPVFAADGWDGVAADQTWYSDGETSFTITSAAQLAGFAQLVNSGNTFAGKTVALAADVDLGGKEWTPIGQAARSDKTIAAGGHAFAGVFDGGKKTISGLKITQGGKDDAIGLFGAVQGGTIKNVTVAAEINAPSANAGAIVGLLLKNTTVEGCTVSGTVAANECGGIAGRMIEEGTIRNCTNMAAVTGSQNAAGIISKAYYTANGKEMNVENCANNGSIEATGYHAGGIVAFSAANVKDCTNTKPVVTTGNTAGGIVAEQSNYGTISGCKNSGAVQGKKNAAGIVGWVRYKDDAAAYPNSSTIVVSGNKNSASITNSSLAPDNSLGCGGIVGDAFNRVEVTGNENTAASITGTTFAAGVVGAVQPNPENLFFKEQSYAVTNNISTTAIENITGSCKDLYVYNNVADKAVITGNTAGYLAQVGEQKYATLEEVAAAVNAAGTNPVTIKFLRDFQLAVTFAIQPNQNVTIDLNGKTITTTKNEETGRSLYAINNYGTLTVEDSSAEGTGTVIARGIKNLENGKLTFNSGRVVSCDANGGAGIWNEADLVINGGTFNTSYVGTPNDDYGAGCLNNQGTALVTGGTFESVSRRTYAIISTGKIEVTPASDKEVTVSGVHGALAVDGGTAVVNGGSYTSSEYYGLYVSNDGVGTDPTQAAVTVNGGTFSGKSYSVWIGSDINDPVNSTIEIKNGTFEKPLNAQDCTREGAIRVSGGSFSETVAPEYCAPGFAPKDNGDGTFGVAEVKNQISADVVDAVITEAEGVQTGIIRFITKVDKLTDTPESFGTYMIPLFVFEKEKSLDAAAVVIYTGEKIQAGQTYSADLTGVPADYLNRPIYAQSFMNFAGENALMCKFTETSVNDVAK